MENNRLISVFLLSIAVDYENVCRSLRYYKNGNMIRKMKADYMYQFLPDFKELMGCTFRKLLLLLGIVDVSYWPRRPEQPPEELIQVEDLDERYQLLEYCKHGNIVAVAHLINKVFNAVDWVCV